MNASRTSLALAYLGKAPLVTSMSLRDPSSRSTITARSLQSLDATNGRFEWGYAPRRKRKHPQRLAIDDMVRPILKKWWEAAGSPLTGSVFPALRDGKHAKAGKGEEHNVSHASALRTDLRGAFGIDELKPQVVKQKNGRKLPGYHWGFKLATSCPEKSSSWEVPLTCCLWTSTHGAERIARSWPTLASTPSKLGRWRDIPPKLCTSATFEVQTRSVSFRVELGPGLIWQTSPLPIKLATVPRSRPPAVVVE